MIQNSFDFGSFHLNSFSLYSRLQQCGVILVAMTVLLLLLFMISVISFYVCFPIFFCVLLQRKYELMHICLRWHDNFYPMSYTYRSANSIRFAYKTNKHTCSFSSAIFRISSSLWTFPERCVIEENTNRLCFKFICLRFCLTRMHSHFICNLFVMTIALMEFQFLIAYNTSRHQPSA